jgi:putative endopeptidase
MPYFNYYTRINKTDINNNKYTIKQNSKKKESSVSLIQNRIYHQIENMIKSHTHIPEFKQIQQYNHVNEHTQMVEQIVFELDLIYKYTEVTDVIKYFIMNGHHLPFLITTELNPYNPSKTVLKIMDNDLSLYCNLYSNKKIIYNYTRLLNNIFDIVFGKNHNLGDVTNIINIEKKLVSFQLDEKGRSDIIKDLKLYTVSDIQHIGLDLKQILPSSIFISKNDNLFILISNPTGTRLMLSYIKKNWDNPDWKIYWIYQFIKTYYKCIPDLLKIIGEFGHKYLNENIKPKLLYYTQWSPYKINYYYYKYYKNTKEIEFCKKLADKYINAFIHKIQENKWMSPKTKQLCIRKLSRLEFKIGYDDNWNHTLNEYTPSILQNILNMNNKYYNQLIHDIKTTPYDNASSYLVNAYYIMNQNKIYIPNGILQPPFIDITKNMVYNLACVGTIIGHEISHSIDLDGLYYNDENIYNKHTWLSVSEIKTYKSLQTDIIKYLEYMSKTDKLHINGSLYISETVSDITGLLLSEQILLDYLKDQNLPIMPNLRQFYIYYTKLWKNTKSIKQKSLSSYGDFHMFEKYRINCALISSIHFRELYNIKKVYENIL